MSGLLLKDLMNLKKIGRQYLGFFAVMAVMALVMKNPSFLAMCIVLCGSMMVLSSFSFDEYAKFDLYVLTLPVSRMDVVKSKYLLMALFVSASTAAGILLSLLLNLFLGAEDMPDLVLFALGQGAGFCIAFAVMLPFVFRLGVEKGRLVMVALFSGVFGMIYTIVRMKGALASSTVVFVISGLSEAARGVLVAGGLLAVSILASGISYLISKNIMKKKEY